MASPPASRESRRTGYGIVGPSASPVQPNRPLQGRSDAMPYKLLSYQADRTPRAGVLVADTVYDAAKVTAVAGHASVLGVLGDWSRARRLLAQAAKRLEAGRGRAKGIPLKRVKLLAPVLYPGNISCAGPNSPDHIARLARPHLHAPGPTL